MKTEKEVNDISDLSSAKKKELFANLREHGLLVPPQHAAKWAEVLEQVQGIVKGFTYKPGIAKLKYFNGQSVGGLAIGLELTVPDKARPNQTVEIGTKRGYPYPVLIDKSPEALKTFMQKEIREMVLSGEMHEADEWMRFDGVVVFDPHSEKEHAHKAKIDSRIKEALATLKGMLPPNIGLDIQREAGHPKTKEEKEGMQ